MWSFISLSRSLVPVLGTKLESAALNIEHIHLGVEAQHKYEFTHQLIAHIRAHKPTTKWNKKWVNGNSSLKWNTHFKWYTHERHCHDVKVSMGPVLSFELFKRIALNLSITVVAANATAEDKHKRFTALSIGDEISTRHVTRNTTWHKTEK